MCRPACSRNLIYVKGHCGVLCLCRDADTPWHVKNMWAISNLVELHVRSRVFSRHTFAMDYLYQRESLIVKFVLLFPLGRSHYWGACLEYSSVWQGSIFVPGAHLHLHGVRNEAVFYGYASSDRGSLYSMSLWSYVTQDHRSPSSGWKWGLLVA